MADKDRTQMSTCPICGYTDSSTDAQTLQSALSEHIRSAHNLDSVGILAASSVKPAGRDDSNYDTEPPPAAPVANLGNAPSAAMAPPSTDFDRRGQAADDNR